MKFFEELGQRVERRWLACDGNEAAFAGIAAEELERRPVHREVSVDDIYEHVARPDSRLEPQADIEAKFGEPPITLFTGRGLYIDANVWADSTTSIHQHSFDGAFQVLAGSSVHSRYRFHDRECISTRLKLGELEFTGVELLNVGETVAVPAGPSLIHALFHLEQPSVTIVVRTQENPAHYPQYSYLRPGLAEDAFFRPPTLMRQLQLLTTLRRTGHERYREWLRRLVLGADAHTAFSVLFRAFHLAESMEEVTEQVEPLARELAALRPWGGAVAEVLDHHASSQALFRARGSVRDPERRWFLALLLNVPAAKALYPLIRERYPDKDPIEQAYAWTEALAAEPGGAGLGIEFGEGSLAVLHGLMQRKPLDRIAAELTDIYGETAEPADLVALAESFRASCLRPLLDPA